jgi:outer membrane receptor protein involved in Fe transport
VIDPESGSTTQYAVSVVNGGNPLVKPELADTLTYGVVYQPSWLQGFAISVDAYDIDIKDAIGQLGVQAIVDQCRQGATDLCSAIVRGDNGFISLVSNLYINTDATKARGIDLESSFTHPIKLFGGNENLSVRLLASYVAELSTKQRGAAKVDRAGQTGPLAPGALLGGAPEWQGTVALGYVRGPLSVALEERLIADGEYDATWVEGIDVDDNHVASAQYTNLQVAYRSGLGSGQKSTYELSLNVTNLFDEDPAISPNQFGFTGSTATNSGLFDIYGRRYTVGVKLNF